MVNIPQLSDDQNYNDPRVELDNLTTEPELPLAPTSLIPLVPAERRFTKKQFIELLDIESKFTSGILCATLQVFHSRLCTSCTSWTEEAFQEV